MPVPYEVGFIRQTFRDVADQDYLSARILHRGGLDLQFMWCGLQAVEKYLKGILLFNGRSAKRLNHDLTAAFQRVLSIEEIIFDFPDDLADFLRDLELCGTNRYLQRPMFVDAEDIVRLDRCVWHLRRYCDYLRVSAPPARGYDAPICQAQLGIIQSPTTLANPRRFTIMGGWLEGVLRERTARRAYLVHGNEYFGPFDQAPSQFRQLRTVSINPMHYLEPELFAELDERVEFPKAVRNEFKASLTRLAADGGV